jgi:hypothetical protein
VKAIGDTIYWVEANANYGKQIPCPMCFGKRFVTVILGDDSRVESECGMCQHGRDRPSGITTTYEPTAVVHKERISGISTKDGVKYEVGWRSLYAHEIYDSEEIAEEVRKAKFIEVTEQAEKWRKDNFVTCTKKQIWSTGYHRSCIERLENNIEWHKMRLNLGNKPANSEQGKGELG